MKGPGKDAPDRRKGRSGQKSASPPVPPRLVEILTALGLGWRVPSVGHPADSLPDPSADWRPAAPRTEAEIDAERGFALLDDFVFWLRLRRGDDIAERVSENVARIVGRRPPGRPRTRAAPDMAEAILQLFAAVLLEMTTAPSASALSACQRLVRSGRLPHRFQGKSAATIRDLFVRHAVAAEIRKNLQDRHGLTVAQLAQLIRKSRPRAV